MIGQFFRVLFFHRKPEFLKRQAPGSDDFEMVFFQVSFCQFKSAKGL